MIKIILNIVKEQILELLYYPQMKIAITLFEKKIYIL